MKRWTYMAVFAAFLLTVLATVCWARGTGYQINWPDGHIGPVWVQVYDIRVNPPYELLDRFRVWVTWGGQTKCYEIGNWGTYTLEFYKHHHCKGPMIILGNAASFRIRYSLTPPWI